MSNLRKVVDQIKFNLNTKIFDSVLVQVDEEIKLSANFTDTKSSVSSFSTLNFDCVEAFLSENEVSSCQQTKQSIYFEKDFALDLTEYVKYKETIEER